ncbi:hypothetical protein HHI36_009742 [Cryptolaemus montrouzieri]|uniref:Neuroendocrine protein 7B2 n=1 Tax=Cryptolaemus montrouzieri TaxID=559131 RepID=A0ABD2MGQ1_9CUCU
MHYNNETANGATEICELLASFFRYVSVPPTVAATSRGDPVKEGCLKHFENTAAFSRRFQEEQDCMCDTEHMFDCPDNTDPFLDDPMDSFNDFEFDQFVRQHIQNIDQNFEGNRMLFQGLYNGKSGLTRTKGVQGLNHKNLVAKKLNKDDSRNPFLSGERLPVAAKKGNRAF